MAGLFWRFCMYSFLGYLLERLYAAATRSPRQVRKGFLLLPLCPVYGLGVLAVEALPPALTGNFFSLALWGGLTATAVDVYKRQICHNPTSKIWLSLKPF